MPFIKYFLQTLTYLTTAENHDYYEEVIESFYRSDTPDPGIGLLGTHCECLLYLPFIHTIIFWDETVDHQLLDVCDNYLMLP